MSLLKGNELDVNKMKDISLLLRKEVGKEKFDEILIGDLEILMTYYEKIKEYIDKSLTLSKQEIQEIKNVDENVASTTENDKKCTSL